MTDSDVARQVAEARKAYLQALLDVQALAHQLTPDVLDLPTDCPGWSVRDHVAHVGGLESTLLGRPRPDHEPDWAAMTHIRNDPGRFMEVDVDLRRSWPWAQVLVELDEVLAARVAEIAAWPDDPDFPVLGPLGQPRPLIPVVPVRAFDVWQHEQDIRHALGRPTTMGAPAAPLAISPDPQRRPLGPGRRRGSARRHDRGLDAQRRARTGVRRRRRRRRNRHRGRPASRVRAANRVASRPTPRRSRCWAQDAAPRPTCPSSCPATTSSASDCWLRWPSHPDRCGHSPTCESRLIRRYRRHGTPHVLSPDRDAAEAGAVSPRHHGVDHRAQAPQRGHVRGGIAGLTRGPSSSEDQQNAVRSGSGRRECGASPRADCDRGARGFHPPGGLRGLCPGFAQRPAGLADDRRLRRRRRRPVSRLGRHLRDARAADEQRRHQRQLRRPAVLRIERRRGRRDLAPRTPDCPAAPARAASPRRSPSARPTPSAEQTGLMVGISPGPRRRRPDGPGPRSTTPPPV